MIFIPIIILSTVIKGQLITVDLYTLCHCNQLPQQDSCDTMGEICTWSNNQCNVTPCQSINSNCDLIPNCYFLNGSCLDFTSCNLLSGNSISICQAQNIQCSWTFGTNCTPISLMNCGQIYEISYCTVAGNSLCYWSDGLCSEMTECSQQTSENTCNGTGSTCYWNSGESLCQQNNCALQIICLPVLVNPSMQNQYQVCVLGDYFCENGNISDISEGNCLEQSLYTFYWDPKSKKCQACSSINYDQLLEYVIGMILLQIVI